MVQLVSDETLLQQFLRSDQLEHAIIHLRRLPSLSPISDQTGEKLMNELMYAGEPEIASELLSQSDWKLPCMTWFRLARFFQKAGDSHCAIDCLESLLQANDVCQSLLPLAARLAGQLGAFPIALRACRLSVALAPSDAQALFGLAHYMEKLDFALQDVLNVLEQAMRHAPEHLAIRLSLAKGHYIAGNFDRAFELLSERITSHEIRRLKCSNCLQYVTAILSLGPATDLMQECQDQLARIDSSNKCSEPGSSEFVE